jgi:hypothetical protein
VLWPAKQQSAAEAAGAKRGKCRFPALTASLRAAGPAIYGYLRLTLFLALSAALPGLLLPLLIEIPVYNYRQPALSAIPLLIAGSLLLISYYPRPITVVFSALLTAGSGANTLSAQFTPVADYFPLPGRPDHYFNCPDVLIAAAVLLAPLVIITVGRQAIKKNGARPGAVNYDQR